MRPGEHPEFFRLAPPDGRSRESSIRLARDGRFFHEGVLVEHRGLADAMHTWISRHPDDGRFILNNGWDWTYFTVEDTPFSVLRVECTGDEAWLHLSNGSRVPLDPSCVAIDADGSLVATVWVQNSDFEARFTRHAQTELEPCLVEQEGEVALRAFGKVSPPSVRG